MTTRTAAPEVRRRPKGQQRPVITAVRLSPDEHAQLVAQAQSRGETVSQYLRGLVATATA